MERLDGINELRRRLEELHRYPIKPSDGISMAWEKFARIADLNLRIAELLLNR